MKSFFLKELERNGWQAVVFDWEYRKGNWALYRDTSNWWMIATTNTPRLFDVAEPDEYHTRWTVNLIEHLCSQDDIINDLRSTAQQPSNRTSE